MASRWNNPSLKLLATQEALGSLQSERGEKAQISVRWALEIAGGDYRLGAPYSGHSDDRLLWVYVHPQDGVVLIYTAFDGVGCFSLMTDALYQELLPGCEEIGWS